MTTAKNINPIFIFSLPRTGSTLLQRVLMSHSKISSFAEPHILLPFVHANKLEGTITNYSHISSYRAVSDLVENLPNKEEDYYKFLHEFVIKIFNSLSHGNSIFFLDKTPVYIWIIPEIVKIFPNAKFIFLFRNPMQIYASILTTFSNNSFKKLYRFKRYLDEGFELLSEKYETYKDISYSLNYENFVNDPENTLNDLLDYLKLDYEDNMLNSFSKQDLVGKSKDPTGTKNYKKVETVTLDKWKLFFNTKYRVRILQKYISNLDEMSLSIQGYNKGELIKEIESIKIKWNFSFIIDFFHYNYTKLVIRYKLNILFADNLKWSRPYYMS